MSILSAWWHLQPDILIFSIRFSNYQKKKLFHVFLSFATDESFMNLHAQIHEQAFCKVLYLEYK